LLEGITATLPATGNSDILGNIIGNYANMHNVVGVIGNIGNTRFVGGNVAVSGQINVLGNVVALNFIGDNRGNIIGDYANVITGNIGNTRFVGGNVAVSGQINTLGNVVTPFLIGDHRGNIIGDYANVITGNIGNTRFVGGNVSVSGQINVLGNVIASFYRGNGSLLEGITTTLPANGNSDILGNIIGNYANMHNVVGVIGNIGNTGFVGGNVAVSGQINVLGNVVAPFFIGDNRGNITGDFANVITGNIGNTRFVGGNVAVSGQINALGNVVALTFIGDNRGNIIGDYANVITGNIGNTRFVGGNISVSGQINVLGNVVALTFIGDNRGNIIGDYANVITGNIGNTRFVGGNVAVSGQINVLGNVVALNFIGDNRGNIIGDYANVITGNIGNTRFVGGNVAVSGQINTLGNVVAPFFIGDNRGNVIASGNVTAADGIFSGNVVATRDIRGSNTMTLTCASNANILTVTGTTTNSDGASVIQAVSLRGNANTYSLLRLDNNGGRLLDVNGNGEVSMSSTTVDADYLNITGRTSSFVGNAINVVVPKLSFTNYSFITCRNTNGILFNVDGRGMLTAQCGVNGNVVQVISTSATMTNDMIRIQATNSGTAAWNMISARNGTGNVFRVNGIGGVFGVGAFASTGADYAEMFEWEDGNAFEDDRRGRTVVLGNNGVVHIASPLDNPTDVFGVVSVNPGVLGDTRWNEWSGRFLRDKFGAKLSNTVYFLANVSDENERIRCAINDTSPDGYEKVISSEFIENPKFDPKNIYISREDRPEWVAIGLLGKLRVLPGEIVNPNWKLLKTHKHADGDTLEYLLK
jgi:hypothetical protein